jgi:hypothetical protein
MVVPNTTSFGAMFLLRHDVRNRILLNWTGICTKSAEEPGMADQDQRNAQQLR